MITKCFVVFVSYLTATLVKGYAYDTRLKVKGWKSNVEDREQTAAGWTSGGGGGVSSTTYRWP